MWTHRGHLTVETSDGWVYADTRELVSKNRDRPCGHCGLPNRADGHDACLGEIPGAMNACCGHGNSPSPGYVQAADGTSYPLICLGDHPGAVRV